jgi:hypothetical protein
MFEYLIYLKEKMKWQKNNWYSLFLKTRTPHKRQWTISSKGKKLPRN